MKLGLFSYSYHLSFGEHEVFKPTHKMNLYTFIDRAVELGLDGIQIDPMHLKNKTDEYLHDIVQYVKKNNLYLEYGTTGVSTEHLLEELEIAKKLGSPILRTYIGFDRNDKNVRVADEIQKAIEVLHIVKLKAEKYNIKIAIENHCDQTAQELLELIQAVNSEWVGVCVDLGNFMIHLEDPVASVELLAEHIITTHFKDYAFKMENWGFKSYGVALGDGVIDLATILNILKKKSKLDRIMLEIPVEKEEKETDTLRKEDDFVRRSVLYERNVLGISK